MPNGNAFNGLSIGKGTALGSKPIRLSRATIPVITGEDMTTDTAPLSRYIRLTMSTASRAGTPEEQRKNFFRMQELRIRGRQFWHCVHFGELRVELLQAGGDLAVLAVLARRPFRVTVG